MHRAAKGGNVAAQKAYMQLTPRTATPPALAPEAKAPRAAAVGKKDQANAEAQVAHVGLSRIYCARLECRCDCAPACRCSTRTNVC